MITARAHIERNRHLDAAPDAAWALLQDVPRWGMLFPNVEAIQRIAEPSGEPGDLGAFVWRLGPLGPPGRKVRTVYACRYHADDGARVLTWAPTDDAPGTPSTGTFAGQVSLASSGGGTRGALVMDATLEIPAPSFLKSVVAPLVEAEMGRMTDQFLDRLAAHLGPGGALGV